MKGLKEFFGNISIFQKNVEKELEAKGIEPTDQVKKLEHSRQVIRRIVTVVIVLVFIVSGVVLYFQNKNKQTPGTTTNQVTEVEKPKNDGSSNGVRDTGLEQEAPSKLISMTAKERSEGALKGFEDWYKSFENGKTIFEIEDKELNPEELPEELDLREEMKVAVSEGLRTRLLENLQRQMLPYITDEYMRTTNRALIETPLIIDEEKGLTIVNDVTQPEKTLYSWFLDTEKTEKNSKIIMRNDFPYEWIDWRNDARNREAYKNSFTEIDWDNDLSYEVIGINLVDKKKNIVSPEIVFVIMEYNEKLDKWQLSQHIGGIM
ncbi:hypothetical protein ACODGV_12195 [Vagococcus fluvialis]|uniref:hypothetical protein n=1 Tax=Vagococcus fluvialis TaxID=2738 RepID=UPI003B21AA54